MHIVNAKNHWWNYIAQWSFDCQSKDHCAKFTLLPSLYDNDIAQKKASNPAIRSPIKPDRKNDRK
jgi:hypothetical protein